MAVSSNGNYTMVCIADGVNPTVNPGKVLAFSLSSYDLLFEFTVGQVPDSIGITPDGNYAFIANEAENEGDVPEDDESGFYKGALRLDCAGVDEFSKAILANITYFENAEDVTASLEVPDWAGGEYDGTVLFVAEGI